MRDNRTPEIRSEIDVCFDRLADGVVTLFGFCSAASRRRKVLSVSNPEPQRHPDRRASMATTTGRWSATKPEMQALPPDGWTSGTVGRPSPALDLCFADLERRVMALFAHEGFDGFLSTTSASDEAETQDWQFASPPARMIISPAAARTIYGPPPYEPTLVDFQVRRPDVEATMGRAIQTEARAAVRRWIGERT